MEREEIEAVAHACSTRRPRKTLGWKTPAEAFDEHLRSQQEPVLRRPIEPSQYTSGDYAELARTNGVVLSVGRKGECWDNVVAESFFATIKRELIDTRAWPTRAGLRRGRLRVHRGLVQHAAAALDARLPQPRPIRSTPPQRRPSGGMINTSNLSVEPDQVQVFRWVAARYTLRTQRRRAHGPRGEPHPPPPEGAGPRSGCGSPMFMQHRRRAELNDQECKVARRSVRCSVEGCLRELPRDRRGDASVQKTDRSGGCLVARPVNRRGRARGP